MDRDEIMQMARAAGIENWWDKANADQLSYEAALKRFAALVAAAERAACAAICKDESKRLAESANRMDQRGSTDEAGPVRALAWKCNALKERIEDRGKQ